MSLSSEMRQRVEEYVRPLYNELDGRDTFPEALAVESRVRDLAKDQVHDAALLELLVLFHGVEPRLGNLGTGGRWQLFLRSAGFGSANIQALRIGLQRFETDPGTVEEELLHDAVLLSKVGQRAVIAKLLLLGRKRVAMDRAVGSLDPGPLVERFRTERGRTLAAERRLAADEWIADLRTRLKAEST